jgi:hypothetical protein
VRPTCVAGFELRVAQRACDGQVRVRTRIRWADTPSSAAVLEALLRRAVDARRHGLTLVVEDAPAELAPLMALVGLEAALAVP